MFSACPVLAVVVRGGGKGGLSVVGVGVDGRGLWTLSMHLLSLPCGRGGGGGGGGRWVGGGGGGGYWTRRALQYAKYCFMLSP